MEEEYAGGVEKKFIYINRRAPHGTVYPLESLETVLIGAAFDQDVSMLFIDDGVYQLKKDQTTDAIEFKNFKKVSSLSMHGIFPLVADHFICSLPTTIFHREVLSFFVAHILIQVLYVTRQVV